MYFCGLGMPRHIVTAATFLQMPRNSAYRVPRPFLRVLVMQYIQRCEWEGLVHETKCNPGLLSSSVMVSISAVVQELSASVQGMISLHCTGIIHKHTHKHLLAHFITFKANWKLVKLLRAIVSEHH